jgi:hypothetical protein
MPVATRNSGVEDVLRQHSRELIEVELIGMSKRDELSRAIKDAVNSGLSVDAASEATGLPPDQIRKMIANKQAIEIDLRVLMGS